MALESHKIVFVGPSGAGKTTFLATHTTHSFPTYTPTVFDEYSALYRVPGSDVSLNLALWDTPGALPTLRPLSYPGTSAFILAVDVTSPSAVVDATSLLDEIAPFSPFLLIVMATKAPHGPTIAALQDALLVPTSLPPLVCETEITAPPAAAVAFPTQTPLQLDSGGVYAAADVLLKAGFVRVSLPGDLCSRVGELGECWRSFCGGGGEEKAECVVEGLDMGYARTGDVKEVFQIRAAREMATGIPEQWGECVVDVFDGLESSARSIVRALMDGYGMDNPDAAIARDFDPTEVATLRSALESDQEYVSSSSLLLTHYFADGPGSPCRPHADSGVLTLVLSVGGDDSELQVFDASRSLWVSCAAATEATNGVSAVLMLGDSASTVLGSDVPSTMHRVVSVDSDDDGGDRFAVVFKFKARPSVVGCRNPAEYAVAERQERQELSLGAPPVSGLDTAARSGMEEKVLPLVLRYLEVQELMTASLVCRSWHGAVHRPRLWQWLMNRDFNVTHAACSTPFVLHYRALYAQGGAASADGNEVEPGSPPPLLPRIHSTDALRQFAIDAGALAYIETCASTLHNIQAPLDLAAALLHHRTTLLPQGDEDGGGDGGGGGKCSVS